MLAFAAVAGVCGFMLCAYEGFKRGRERLWGACVLQLLGAALFLLFAFLMVLLLVVTEPQT